VFGLTGFKVLDFIEKAVVFVEASILNLIRNLYLEWSSLKVFILTG
jgi:hypothetical protein